MATATKSDTDDQAVADPVPQRNLTASDIIDPLGRYSLMRIERLLGIPDATIREAGNEGAFYSVFGTCRHPSYEIQGSSLLGWIAKADISYTIRPGTATLNDHQAQTDTPAAPPPKPSTALGQAMEERDEERRQEEQESANYAWGFYRTLLFKGDKRTPVENISLLGVAEDLALSISQVEQHQAAVEKAKSCEASAANLTKKHKEATAAREQRDKLEKRQKKEFESFDRKFRDVMSLYDRGAAAGGHLRQMAKQYPVLFDASKNPPRLRKD